MSIEKALSKMGIALYDSEKKQLSFLNMGYTLHLPQLTSGWDQAFYSYCPENLRILSPLCHYLLLCTGPRYFKSGRLIFIGGFLNFFLSVKSYTWGNKRCSFKTFLQFYTTDENMFHAAQYSPFYGPEQVILTLP